MQIADQIIDPMRTTGDIASIGVIGATLMKWLPEATAIVGFVWFVLRCYETILDIRGKRRKP